jgi:hypothetical protein
MKSLLICHQGARLEHEVMAPWLASFSELSGIVVIDANRRQLPGKVRRQIRRVGALRFADVAAFQLYYRTRMARADAAWEAGYVTALSKRFPPPADPPAILHTRDANADVVVDFIGGLAPDLTIARCSVLLDERVFSLPRCGTFVMHPGIVPEYRNSHGCFWALANRDLERVGATLLQIDAGVDTGPVYGYYRYDFDERRESHVVIQKRAVYDNLDPLREKLVAIADGRAQPIDTGGRESASWGQPWLTAYLRWKRASGRPL